MRIIYIVTAAALLMPAAASAQKVGATRQQVIDHAAKRFAKLDADGNGQVTSAELAAQTSGKPKMAKRMMKTNDADGNGSISLQEFQNAAGAHFDKLDANKNGTIDDGEQAGHAAGGGGE